MLYNETTKRFLLLLFTFEICSFVFSQEDRKISSFEGVLKVGLENSYDIKNQKMAVLEAQGSLLQTKGSFDVNAGGQAGFSNAHTPYDESNLTVKSETGILYNDIEAKSVSGKLFLEKLFSFGIGTKLSYELQNGKSSYLNGIYEKNNLYDSYGNPKYNAIGKIQLEISIPLLKAFNDALADNNLKVAEYNLELMKSKLEDTVALSIINISKAYWNYYSAYENLKENEELQERLEERESITQKLIAGGARSKNDLLKVQVKVLENRQTVDECYSNFLDTKSNLAQTIGIKADDIDFPIEQISNYKTFGSEKILDELDLSNNDIEDFINNRPDVLALVMNVKVCEQKLRRTKIDSRPDINFGFQIGTSGAKYDPNFGEELISAFDNNRGLNWAGTLSFSKKFMNNEKNGQILQAQASYESSLNSLNKKKNQLEQQISDSLEMLKKYETAIENAETIMQLQESIYENEQKRYENGLTTIENMMDADSTFVEANRSYYRTYIKYLTQILQVKYETGNLIYISDKNVKLDDLY